MTPATPPSAPSLPAPPQPLERILALLLQTGIALSLGLVALGLLGSLALQPRLLLDPQTLTPLLNQTTPPQSPKAATPHLLHLPGTNLISLGLLILILTPVLRVAASLLVFAIQRDRLYSLITATVLLLLILSFALGHLE